MAANGAASSARQWRWRATGKPPTREADCRRQSFFFSDPAAGGVWLTALGRLRGIAKTIQTHHSSTSAPFCMSVLASPAAQLDSSCASGAPAGSFGLEQGLRTAIATSSEVLLDYLDALLQELAEAMGGFFEARTLAPLGTGGCRASTKEPEKLFGSGSPLLPVFDLLPASAGRRPSSASWLPA